MDKEEFYAFWGTQSENQADYAVETAWRRYQHVQETSGSTEETDPELSLGELRSSLEPFLDDTIVDEALYEVTSFSLTANSIPWTIPGVQLKRGQTGTTFAVGRVWRSKELDMFLQPQFALWYRVGVNGRVFNSTADTNTFLVESDGELFIANQFPGQFGEPIGGRLASPLSVYENVEGQFEVMILVWKEGVNA